MKHRQIIRCKHCNGEDLQKNGNRSGIQGWHCKSCKKYFQFEYRYKACEEGVKEQVIELTMNSSGIRDISRTLGISTVTVMSVIKKTLNVNPYVLDLFGPGTLSQFDVGIYYTAEMDEFWSFVGSKGNQRWTWYAMDKKSGIILAWHNGKRTDKDFLQLLEYLKGIPILLYFTDNWGSYPKYLDPGQHYIGKGETWEIERKNLNSRTHLKRLNRKTICYSKCEQMHDKVIGAYIERHYYKSGTYGTGAVSQFNT